MSKEAMKLALEALEGLEALLLSMGLTHLIVYGDAEKAITALRKALANEALERMAQNARELGLDYDTSAGTQVSKVWWDGEKLMAKPIPLAAFYEQDQQGVDAVDTLTEEGWIWDGDQWQRAAQPQQEPVAWLIDNDYTTVFLDIAEAHRNKGANVEPLYTSPQPAQQEPTSGDYALGYAEGFNDACKPAQRPWVGLTHKEVYECEPKTDWHDSVDFADAIETKLKEKNFANLP